MFRLTAAVVCGLSTAVGVSQPGFSQDDGDRDQEESPLEQMVISASPLGRSQFETIVGTTVLADDDLARRLEGSIGETLRREPGISSTFFGPGASRPVIRGLGGDRIRVLDAGIGSIDASATSDDHAVAVESALAERIEVVRGPATLLYGSSAAGGVVNVFDGRIPDAVPEGGFDIGARFSHSTVDNGNEASGAATVKVGSLGDADLVIHADGFYRDTENYEIPGFAESALFRAAEEEEEGHEEEGEEGHDEEEEEEAFGIVENSDIESKGGSGGVSLIFDNGFIGISAKVLDSNYGVPGGHGHEEEGHEEEGHEEEGHDEEEEEEAVRIDLEQTRIDLHGELDADLGPFQKAKLRIGYADYEHRELEGPGEVGTVFSNEGWEGRLELVQGTPANQPGLNGAVGVQWRFRDFSAIGEEAFVPPTESRQFGIFAVEEYVSGDWRFELGGRYEHTSHTVVETGLKRSFDGFSVSGGVGFAPSENWFAGVTAFRTARAPATEELFANGPHLATNAFEVGNPDFGKEKAYGAEGTLRYQIGEYTFAVNGFATSYNDFIALIPTGEEEDGLPVFEFQALSATFIGLEAMIDAHIGVVGPVDLHADAAVDLVRADTNALGNDNLPRIPPINAIIGAEARSAYADFRIEGEFAAAQNRNAEFELPTEGYQVLNMFLTVYPLGEDRNLALEIKAANLTDAEARLHTSFLKDLAPLPGRNFRLTARANF